MVGFHSLSSSDIHISLSDFHCDWVSRGIIAVKTEPPHFCTLLYNQLLTLTSYITNLETPVSSPSYYNLTVNMAITHIVLFQLKAGLSAEVVNDVRHSTMFHKILLTYHQLMLTPRQVCTRMLALKDNCIHPTSQKPYIVSSSGGVDNSPEGLQVCHRHGPNSLSTIYLLSYMLMKMSGGHNPWFCC